MRRAEVRTPLPDAERVAAAVRPDNTPELTTGVEDGAVVTTIERETTGGLRATLDDYLVNLALAQETGARADAYLADREPVAVRSEVEATDADRDDAEAPFGPDQDATDADGTDTPTDADGTDTPIDADDTDTSIDPDPDTPDPDDTGTPTRPDTTDTP